jgi:hypothetical protein
MKEIGGKPAQHLDTPNMYKLFFAERLDYAKDNDGHGQEIQGRNKGLRLWKQLTITIVLKLKGISCFFLLFLLPLPLKIS